MIKTNFKTVIFAIIFATMNRHTYKLFKVIFNNVQIDGKGEINKALQNYSKNFILILYQLKGFRVVMLIFISPLPSV